MKKVQPTSNTSSEPKVRLTRREALSGTLAGTAALGLLDFQATAAVAAETEGYSLEQPENQILTSCLQCNTGCGIKVKVLDGVVVKIDGSPYSPWCLYPHIPYSTPVAVSAPIDGHLCPKGAAGIQTAYDPYRIRRVLKRAGKRGEMKWFSIPFEQAIAEIVSGGKLFAHVPGEEEREVEGLASLHALRDPKLAKAMGADAAKVGKKEMTLAEFQEKYRDHLDLLIDPNHPDFGPKNNHFCFSFGRLKSGRKDFIERFVRGGFGSTNVHGHTTVCQGSLYFSGKAMSEQLVYDEKDKKVKWTGGEKFYWQADLAHAEFVIFVGAGVWEGGYGPPLRTPQITEGLASGRLKFAVVDPRFSKLASKAWKWVPAKNGSEGALALGMIRWLFENDRIHHAYLRAANKAASAQRGEPTWTNATWLVKCEEKDGKLVPGSLLYASDLGLPKIVLEHTRTVEVPEVDSTGRPLLDEKGKPRLKKVSEVVNDAEGKPIRYELDRPIVFANGKLVPFNPNDSAEPAEGDLFVERPLTVRDKEGKTKEIVVKTGLTLLRESAFERSIEEWAEICGISPNVIVELAREFSEPGRRSVVDIHRGVSQHTNGYYNVQAWYSLCLLRGIHDHIGGLMKPTTYSTSGTRPGQPYPLDKLHPGKIEPFGISTIRHGIKYEDTTLFDPAKGKENYPAKRPWWPLASDVYQETLPSIGDAYPYPTKVLLTYMAAPTYSLPGGQTNIEVLQNLERLPLHVACDIAIGETSMYADYIFPDLSYLERWEFHGSHPTVAWKVQPVRQPALPPIPETVQVFGQAMPISIEALLLALAEALKVPGFGADGFGTGQPLTHPDHFYLRAVANLACGEKPTVQVDGRIIWPDSVPEASDEELAIFHTARKHLPPSVFDEERWKQAAGELHWRRVVYVLNRGGRFEDFAKAFEKELLKNKYGKQVNLYCEKTAKTKNAMTGKAFSGIARYFAIQAVNGTPIEDEQDGFDLHLMTYREIMQTKSRTISNYYLNALRPENFILIHPSDAKARGFKEGDLVHVVSATNLEGVWDFGPIGKRPMAGKVHLTEGIRPGVIAFSLGHGHWAMGSTDFELDGRKVRGDERRAKGVHLNAAMRLDPALQNTSLLDPVGGSVSFYDTKVRLEGLV